MRGVFWSSMAIFALFVSGYMLSALLNTPYHPPVYFNVRNIAMAKYIQEINGSVPKSTSGALCVPVVWVDANGPIEALAEPKVISICGG